VLAEEEEEETNEMEKKNTFARAHTGSRVCCRRETDEKSILPSDAKRKSELLKREGFCTIKIIIPVKKN
jgi:hypothetical protein